MPTVGPVVIRVAQILGAAVLFKDYVAEAAVCSGDSMLPTLRSQGDMLLIEKLSTAFGSIRRGDVVVCASPSDPTKLICKRVIGLENDLVATHYGGIFTSHQQVPPGHLWIEGDNSARSHDSRDFGPVPCGLLRGRALCKVRLAGESAATCYL